MPDSDSTLPENSKENLDRKLDHAIKETFPTSDPVSVTITKGGAIDYDEHGVATSGFGIASGQGGSGTAERLVEQARDTLSSVADAASETTREAYTQGRRYVREAADRFPEAERYYREGTQVLRQYTPENPLWTVLMGAIAGYGIAWMIHHESWRRRDEVPDYARTRRRFTPYDE